MKGIFHGVLALSLLGAPVAMADEHHDADQHQGNHEGDRHDGDHDRGMHREWHHGDRFERHAGDHYIVVTNWHHHHLRRPPHGYHWVQTDDGYILVSIGNGIVLDFIVR